MWTETENGSFVNLDYVQSIALEDVRENPSGAVSVRIVAILSSAGGDGISVLRSFEVRDDLPLEQARAGADTYMQGIRQVLVDKGVFIRPARRLPGTTTMYGQGSKKTVSTPQQDAA